jgi:hypothetical protein
MGLEATVKYHFPKGQNFSGTSPQTSPDTLTGTDYIAAMGMAMARAPIGYSAFMGKVGVSENDAANAVFLLTEFAFNTCDKVAALRKLDEHDKLYVMQTLATYAFMDYCRSAASKKPCSCCDGEGFIDAEVFTMKGVFSVPGTYEMREQVRVLCKTCKGKGLISTACRDCNGRGRAVMKAETEKQGVPVMGDCKRCCGRGFERIPSTEAHNAVCMLTDEISLDTWKKSVKPFYDELITKLEVEESWANAALNKVTA